MVITQPASAANQTRVRNSTPTCYARAIRIWSAAVVHSERKRIFCGGSYYTTRTRTFTHPRPKQGASQRPPKSRDKD
eukprot:9586323-Lingulodinium_polyedra.AAC.1